MKLMTFEDALKKANRENRQHVLLGNGFSIALEPDIFRYEALYNNANFSSVPNAREIFEALETHDFEQVLRVLQQMSKIIDIYAKEKPSLAESIKADADKIKEVFVHAVAYGHPERPYSIEQHRYQYCRKFLNNFNHIYSVNYDVLLYWALMNEDADELNLTPDDGFRDPTGDGSEDYVAWTSHQSATVHYLHGALHLFDAGDELQKYTWSRTGEPIVDQIRDALDNDKFPLFVSEGTSREKLSRIMHNAYLHKSLRSLEQIGGSLVIFGHSLGGNDHHIIEAIGKSRITKCFISLYGDPDSDTNRHIRDASQQIEKISERYHKGRTPEIHFFDAASAKVWGP